MDDEEIKTRTWLAENGVVDATVAKAVFLALDMPGQHGPYRVAYDGDDIIVTGPSSQVVLHGSNDIQAMRMRLDEIIANPRR